MGFVLHRASWERVSDEKNLDFWAAGLNEQGEPKPGAKELVLHVLQIKPLLVAYESFQLGSETVVLVRDKVLAQLSESLPSSLLQAYALAVAGAPREGSVFFLVLSLGLSLGSMADAANKGYRRLCAPTIEPWMNLPNRRELCIKAVVPLIMVLSSLCNVVLRSRKMKCKEPGALPEAGLLAWRCADVGGRICGWALLGMALRPVDASRTPVSIGARLKEETAMSL